MALKMVNPNKIDKVKIQDFLTALAGVEAQCQKVKGSLSPYLDATSFATNEAVASLQAKIKNFEENFALAKSRGKGALKSIKKALG